MRRSIALVIAAFLVIALAAATPGHAERRQHWIGVRERVGQLELFDRRTGDRFIPRGVNLLMKVRERDHVASGLFRPRDWKPRAVDRELTRIAARGYNIIRVFIDLCEIDCISTANGNIREAYAENIASFLRMARTQRLVVLLSSNDLPVRGYDSRLPCCSPFGGYRNSLWLAPEGHDLLEEYWTEVVEALRRQRAPLEVVIYQIQQEQFVLGDVEPLSLSEGLVMTADGQSYDMSDPAQKAEMIASNVRLATRRVRAAIRELDPGALVSMGFFADFPDDPRVVPSAAMLESSALDFVDLHLYPGARYGLDAQVQALGMSDGVVKPVVMGEFGAFRFAYANPRVASHALAHWQADSCAYGFAGWLVWLWAKSDEEVFGAREDGGAIAGLLSPEQRLNPCSAEGVPANVAPLGTATASASLPQEPPANAIDGLAQTNWNAGDFPPQWIELDLGAERPVREIHLAVAQFPEGSTHHRLLLAGADGVFALVADFRGVTGQNDVLSFVSDAPLDTRFVRVETVASPSWVAWSEIQVFEALT